jgi:ribosomal protein S27E
MDRPASGDHLEGVRGIWATDPERIDPDDYPPRTRFARLMTWAHCPVCDLQVHVLYCQSLLQGVSCPTCGSRLLTPPNGAEERLMAALHREDEFSRHLEAHAE